MGNISLFSPFISEGIPPPSCSLILLYSLSTIGAEMEVLYIALVGPLCLAAHSLVVLRLENNG